MEPSDLDALLRLGAATLAGMAIGLNRDLHGKPTGMRTLGLVALGAALVAVASVHYQGLDQHPDALSRVVQGVLQGVLAGVGFIGAGAIVRGGELAGVQGLTTAATVWVTAAIGIACALAAWWLVVASVVLTLALLILGKPLERMAVGLIDRLNGAPPREDL